MSDGGIAATGGNVVGGNVGENGGDNGVGSNLYGHGVVGAAVAPAAENVVTVGNHGFESGRGAGTIGAVEAGDDNPVGILAWGNEVHGVEATFFEKHNIARFAVVAYNTHRVSGGGDEECGEHGVASDEDGAGVVGNTVVPMVKKVAVGVESSNGLVGGIGVIG